MTPGTVIGLAKQRNKKYENNNTITSHTNTSEFHSHTDTVQKLYIVSYHTENFVLIPR